MPVSHEWSVRKEDMNAKELDMLLRCITPAEQRYLDDPNAISERYANMERQQIHGREVYFLRPNRLAYDEIHLRKDSRFTSTPYYSHPNVNINYIYSGHCDYLIDDVPVTLHKGDVCIFDIDVVRRKLVLGEDDIVINLNMTQGFFKDSLFHKAGQQNVFSDFLVQVLSTANTTHDHYLIFRAGESPEIERLFKQLLIEYYGDEPLRKQMIQSYFSLIFLQLLRLHQIDSANNLVQIATTRSKSIIEVLYYIEAHAIDCTLAQLGTQFGYHPKYISARLKEETGMSFKQIQTRERLRLVCERLVQTDEPIHCIATSCGFTNMTAFYRVFSDRYDMTPLQYRKQGEQ